MNSNINICFSSANDPIAKVIKWATKSKVSHCFISFYSPVFGTTMVMEAYWTGFRLLPISQWNVGEVVECFTLTVPEEKQVEALRKQKDYLETEYDYLSILPLLLRRVKSRFKNPFDSPEKLICSESVAKFLNDCGVAKIDNPSSWTPGDLYRFIKSNKELFTKC